MTFTVKKLSVDHAAEWQSLKFECVNSFQLGFLITPEEALETTQDRARYILSSGSTRGIFDHERLVGFCGYRPEPFERSHHRASIGPFFVSSKYQGCGAA